MFNTKGHPIKLAPGRKEEIETYLRTFQASHVCHTTSKTCYGGLKIQAEMAYRLKIITVNSVKIFLAEAQKYISTNS